MSEDSTLTNLIRAKSKKEGETDNKSLLLKDHIKEVLDKINEILNMSKFYNSSLPLLSDNEWKKALFLAGFLHDLGKISYDFQYRLYNRGDFPKELENLLKESKGISLRHEILSIVWASILLDNIILEVEHNNQKLNLREFIFSAILFHHYNELYGKENADLEGIIEPPINGYQQIEKYIYFLENNLMYFKDFLIRILNEIKNYSEYFNDVLNNIYNLDKIIENIKDKLDKKIDVVDIADFYDLMNNNEETNNLFYIFLGMLRRADYSASGNVNIEDIVNDTFYDDIENNILEKIIQNNPWQKRLLSSLEAKNLILVAPTGSGKTEFSLFWNNKLKRKLIYTLPLRVALNDLYDRFNTNYIESDKVGLLHSTAFLEYLKESERGSDLNIDEKVTSSKLLSQPIILSTPDQVFLISLKYYGFDKILSLAPYSSFVIDEIQAYSPEMAAITIKSLEMLKKAGANLLIMTATLPPYFEDFLRNEVGLHEIIDVSKKTINDIKNLHIKRHKISLIPIKISDEENSDEDYKEELKNEVVKIVNKIIGENKKNILIIVNNVKKAISIYEILNEKVKEDISGLYLLHSRLIEKQKEKVITEVKEKLENENPVVLVSTQVVEASVDFDFDVLITELSPIDSQIQRWGRVWRNKNDNYESKDPNIYVIYGEGKEGLYIDKGTKAIYSPKEYIEQTYRVLKDTEAEGSVLDYKKEKELINKVFDEHLRELFKNNIEKILNFLSYYSDYIIKRSEAQRVFRKLAGIQIIFPEIMINEKEESIKKLGKIIKDVVLNKKEEPTYNELINELSLDSKDNAIHLIRKYLTEYSVNIPFYYFETRDNKKIGYLKTFKGFYVGILKKDVNITKLIEEGIDAVIDKDIDEIIEDNLNKTIPNQNVI